MMYAHPAVVIHLQLLFRLILSHGFVPDKFGHGMSIPLIKDTRSSAIADGPREALVSRNPATTKHLT